ncbi:MAG: tetratricopeptide repeat protein [Terriglobia bacterium]
MAFKKAKALEAAQKLIAQGKMKDAIGEYHKIHAQDPKDQNALNMLGDLHVRLKKLPEALGYYVKLADMYASDGFLVRGIAMYKKISKLDRGNITAMERLADLYTMQGLMNEARTQYLELAETHLKGGQSSKALEVMRKVLDLEPDNLRVQLRLAELYQGHGQSKEATGIYCRLAERGLSENQTEECKKWLEKAVALAPQDAGVALLQARLQHQSGETSQALSTLEKIANLDDHPDALELLLRLRLEAGEAEASQELAEKLFAADSTKFAGFLALARLAAQAQDGARALALLQKVAEPALEHDPPYLLEVARSVVSLLPDATEALDLQARAARAAHDSEALTDALGRLGQAAEQAEDFAHAKQLYQELASLVPGNPDFAQQLNRVREKLGEPTAPAEAAPAPADTPEGALEAETQAFVNSSLTDIDLFSSYGMTDKAIELAQELLARVPTHLAGHEKLLDFHVGSGNDRGVVEIARRLEPLYRQAGNDAKADEMAAMARRYSKKVGQAVGAAEEVPAQERAEAALHEVDLSAEWDAVGEAPEAPAAAAAPAFNAAEAKEEIAFYLNQGLTDEARQVLARYQEQFPGEPALEELRGRVEAAVAPAAESKTPAEVSAEDAEKEEAFEVVLEEKPAADAPAGVPMSAGEFFSDLAGELDETISAAEPPPETTAAARPHAVAKSQPEPAPVSARAEPEPPAGVLADVFEEFKREMGEVEEVEDTETHYNLGIAYKEMGLMDEAISEFQKVAKAAEAQKTHPQLFQCCTLLGLCFIEKGIPQIAVRWYERALQTPGLDAEGALALRYDMGVAHEQAGNRQAALECFMEVYGTNVDYRDVGDRIRTLQGT